MTVSDQCVHDEYPERAIQLSQMTLTVRILWSVVSMVISSVISHVRCTTQYRILLQLFRAYLSFLFMQLNYRYYLYITTLYIKKV